MTLSFRNIADILKAIDDSSADEIDIEVEGLRLSVKKRGAAVPASQPTQSEKTDPVRPEAKPVEPQSVLTDKSDALVSNVQTPPGHEFLRAPMVGTFYRRPSPDEPPFVEVGSTVAKGDPVCLIEVMKLYTTIESTADGDIVSIFAEDGNLVEFDQPLFQIKT